MKTYTDTLIEKSKQSKKDKKKEGFLQRLKNLKKRKEYEEFQKSRKILIQPPKTHEQIIMEEILGGKNKSWGTGNNLPKLNCVLMPGLKGNKETARLFGLR